MVESSRATPTGYCIGVDIGGTFTDAVIVAPDGTISAGKASSTPHDFSIGFFRAIAAGAESLGLGERDLLAATTKIAHGTTIGINALVTGTVCTAALLATKGHGDAIRTMAGQGRMLGASIEELLDYQSSSKPPPVVPRQQVFEITERVDHRGAVVVAISDEDLHRAIDQFDSIGIDAVAICATDLEIIHHGPPAMIQGDLPFNKNFTPGHEYMGTVVALGPGVDEYAIGQRITVEIHAGCGQCKRCREGMYTACHNYGLNYGDRDKGHRANGFTTDGGFCEYQVNNINTLVAIPDSMSDEEATLVVTAGTAMYGLTELGGLVAGEGVVVLGPGPIGLLGVAVAKALGASPVILTGTRDNRLQIGRELGADHVINVRRENAVEAVRRLTGGKGIDYVIECSGAADAVNEAARMLNRGGKICLAAFPHEAVPVDVAYLVRNNIYLYGIRGEGKSATHRAEAFMTQKRFDATKIHTHTFALEDLPTALKYARERVDDAIKVVVKARSGAAQKVAAE